ncbi:hypothetical protein GobsT_43660 [Gemmata obscuriglobus]|uniref:HEPN domain-containing protein n=2 Tax=Gemmata TaxID=113 RepID=A0A2Z3H243_9BACT|nr:MULTISPECIES: hypothetical protein [Gemmata]AWM37636.1 hypothetical protein C1280_11970 [Gemmata obscuriglobus]MDY3551605.1 hypothetical protein [Gemmata algarum]MDY3560492.1 hypothetical protein [Gemmata algarum]QEG29568.1 hypothetical protein GobsT_43660 [Gemmata obscuriglobus]VTS08817.1 unnamed protein product [Gemmata obscuriglobus UQM 2246]
MKFGATRSQIYDAQKTARAKWDETFTSWDDQVHREHEEKVVEPLDHAVSDALRAIDQLAVLFTQIRLECEFPS